jgi:GMP synthase (glutamine-hydrolysing)
MKDTTAPLLVIETGVPPRLVGERHGDFERMIRASTGLPAERIVVVKVCAGEELGPPSRYGAAVITGSAAMVTDQADWSERTAAWLRLAADAGLPMLGICFGHQLLAHALGGKVDYRSQGREVGTHTVSLAENAAAACPLLEGLPAKFPAHLIHMQSVVALPPGAQVLASSDQEPYQLVQYGPNILSSQFHPEFDDAIMQTYLDSLGGEFDKEGLDVGALRAGLEATPSSQELLRRFAQRYVG